MEGDVVAGELEGEEVDFIVVGGGFLLGFFFHEEGGDGVGVVVEGARGGGAGVGG